MPRGDGTGPDGKGAKTGRGLKPKKGTTRAPGAGRGLPPKTGRGRVNKK